MNEIKDGGAAFPVSGTLHRDGMTLRDYFAAKAMQGLLRDIKKSGDIADCALAAYTMADAMLAARAK